MTLESPHFHTGSIHLEFMISHGVLAAVTQVEVVIYNQSKHATNSVLADIRAVWGSRVRVIQTLEVGFGPMFREECLDLTQL